VDEVEARHVRDRQRAGRRRTATILRAVLPGRDPFILFDIEVVFMFPWAVLYREYVAAGLGLFMLMEMVVFIGILVLGLAYVWRKGALEWD
jgi:hypothetical protein